MNSPFKISVITDELTQDFGRACEVASQEFGMGWVELREIWNKNIMALDAKEIAEARRLLERYKLRISDLATPLFKVDWPGAPLSKSREASQFGASFTFAQQDEVLERALELARVFVVDRVRCFDFWRLDDPAPVREAMDARLLAAAEKCGKKNVVLVIENEHACNTATGPEALRTLNAVRSPHFMLNWDPGNAAELGDTPYPESYEKLPKERIGHVHCKDVARRADGSSAGWACMGKGVIDWTGQFRALKRDGYKQAVSLETHWRGAGTTEESSRQSWAGMKEQLRKAGALS
ncbi:MAG: sugar phosphate isomerase/epimerase [Acidobacteriota bacterium]|nr:sugar phosphate isomerase/epimerase [Acidobacteriota bacterium]